MSKQQLEVHVSTTQEGRQRELHRFRGLTAQEPFVFQTRCNTNTTRRNLQVHIKPRLRTSFTFSFLPSYPIRIYGRRQLRQTFPAEVTASQAKVVNIPFASNQFLEPQIFMRIPTAQLRTRIRQPFVLNVTETHIS